MPNRTEEESSAIRREAFGTVARILADQIREMRQKIAQSPAIDNQEALRIAVRSGIAGQDPFSLRYLLTVDERTWGESGEEMRGFVQEVLNEADYVDAFLTGRI